MNEEEYRAPEKTITLTDIERRLKVSRQRALLLCHHCGYLPPLTQVSYRLIKEAANDSSINPKRPRKGTPLIPTRKWSSNK